jgi:hypothetical protein
MNKTRYRGQSLISWDCSPAELPQEPAPVLAEPRKPPHAAGCWCIECWQAGLDSSEYLKAKRIFDANGF